VDTPLGAKVIVVVPCEGVKMVVYECPEAAGVIVAVVVVLDVVVVAGMGGYVASGCETPVLFTRTPSRLLRLELIMRAPRTLELTTGWLMVLFK